VMIPIYREPSATISEPTLCFCSCWRPV
jgi:hypothetical protein